MSHTPPARVGPYQVVRTLGQGGMGVVYEVRHPARPDQRLALKLLLAENPSQDLLIRFQREAELLAKVKHPNVVGVVEFAQTPAGKPYLVCDFVAGKTLRELCEEAPMDPQQAAGIARDLADALAILHRRQILHRDLKPENVLLTPEGTPMLLDFGLAREVDAERLTVTGSILGTPAYMSPEQAEGSRDLDERTDVYGLGAVLFFLLSGQPPFRGTSPMAVLRKVLDFEPEWPSALERAEWAERAQGKPFPEEATMWTVGGGPAGHDPLGPLPAGAQGTFALPGIASSHESVPFVDPQGPPAGQHPTGFGSSPSGFGSSPGFPQSGFGSSPGFPHSGFGSSPGFPQSGFGSSPGFPQSGFGSQPGAPGVGFGAAAPTGGVEAGAPATGFGQPAGRPLDLAALVEQDRAAARATLSTVIRARPEGDLPAALVAICQLAMRKERQDRYPSAASFRDDLDRFLSSGKVSAGASLRQQTWRRYLPYLGAGALALGVGGAGLWALRSGRGPSPTPGPVAASPSPGPSLPDPSAPASPALPKPASLREALQELPYLGADPFPARLAAAQTHYPDARILDQLAAARSDLEALRRLDSPAARRAAAEAWRRKHGLLPAERLGPLCLELGPRAWWHNPTGKALPLEDPAERAHRRQETGVYPGWLNRGARLVSADGVTIRVWEITPEGSPGNPSTARLSQAPSADTPELRWRTTFETAADPTRGTFYVAGSSFTARGGRPTAQPLPTFAIYREGEVRLVPVGGLNRGTDRFLCVALSEDGSTLVAGTERGELVALRDLEDRKPRGEVALHDPQGAEDVQSLAFAPSGPLVTVASMRQKESIVATWAPRGEQALSARAGELRFEGGYDSSATFLHPWRGDLVLIGREGGRLGLLRAGSPPRLEAELRPAPCELPPVAGACGDTPWGRLAFVATGQPRTDANRPLPQQRGGELLALRVVEDQLEVVARFVLDDPLDSFAGLALSPDGRRLAAGTLRGELLLWELR